MENEVKKLKGIIDKKEAKEGTTEEGKPWKRFAFTIIDQTGHSKVYSTFDTDYDVFKPGESVDVKYVDKSDGKYTYHNILDMDILSEKLNIKSADESPAISKPEVPQSIWDSKDRKIVRQNTLTNANSLIANWIQIDLEGLKKILETTGINQLVKSLATELESHVYRGMEN